MFVIIFHSIGHKPFPPSVTNIKRIVSLFCTARKVLDYLYHKQKAHDLHRKRFVPFCGIAENCPDSRATKKSENALCQYVIISVFLSGVLWGLVKNWGSILGGEDTKIIRSWSCYGKFWCHAICRDAKFCVSTTSVIRCISSWMAKHCVPASSNPTLQNPLNEKRRAGAHLLSTMKTKYYFLAKKSFTAEASTIASLKV